MFNGVLLTTFADLTAISLLFCVGCVAASLFGLYIGRAVVLLIAIAIVSVVIQWQAKRKHVLLGEKQLDYIEQLKKSEVIAMMTALNA